MLKKYILSIAFGAVSLAMLPNVPTSLTIDFKNGMPEDVIVYDLDENTPSPDLPKGCFSENASWVTYDFGGNDGRTAVSTSWYVPAGHADDWMVLPAIMVEEGAELRWHARAWDRNLPDGYSVYVSTSGAEPSDFDRTSPLFSTKAENNEWTDHNITLEDYVGEIVNIAFVNDSEDCSMLLISDIFAGTPQILDFYLDGECFGKIDERLPLRFNVSTQISGEIKGLSVGYEFGDESFSFDFPDVVITADAPSVVEIPGNGILLMQDSPTLYVWMECEGKRVEKSLRVGVHPRRMIVEEATGTWCMWCVGGIVMMEQMKERYPDNFIGIAVHSGDPMAPENYSLNVSSYPQVHINREKKGVSISEVEAFMPSIMEEVPEGIISGAYEIEDGIVTVRTETVTTRRHMETDYNIAIVVTENDVHVPDKSSYSQKNAYAGGENGPMGGFEDKPAVIPANEMWYQDVARCILADERGIPGSVPQIMNPGEEAQFNYSFKLPDNVLNPDNIEVILLLIERKGQRFVNGTKAINKAQPNLGVGSITHITIPLAALIGDKLVVGSETGIDHLRAWSIDGRLIAEQRGDSSTELAVSLNGYHGLVIWEAISGNQTFHGKIM